MSRSAFQTMHSMTSLRFVDEVERTTTFHRMISTTSWRSQLGLGKCVAISTSRYAALLYAPQPSSHHLSQVSPRIAELNTGQRRRAQKMPCAAPPPMIAIASASGSMSHNTRFKFVTVRYSSTLQSRTASVSPVAPARIPFYLDSDINL